MVEKQVSDRTAEEFGIVVQFADGGVALNTQQPPDSLGSVAMIHREAPFARGPRANRADAVLRGEQGVVLLDRDAIFSFVLARTQRVGECFGVILLPLLNPRHVLLGVIFSPLRGSCVYPLRLLGVPCSPRFCIGSQFGLILFSPLLLRGFLGGGQRHA